MSTAVRSDKSDPLTTTFRQCQSQGQGWVGSFFYKNGDNFRMIMWRKENNHPSFKQLSYQINFTCTVAAIEFAVVLATRRRHNELETHINQCRNIYMHIYTVYIFNYINNLFLNNTIVSHRDSNKSGSQNRSIKEII